MVGATESMLPSRASRNLGRPGQRRNHEQEDNVSPLAQGIRN